MNTHSVETPLSILQASASEQLERFYKHGDVPVMTLDLVTEWLSAAVAESDEPVKMGDRIRLADETMISEASVKTELKDILTARNIGRRVVKLAFRP